MGPSCGKVISREIPGRLLWFECSVVWSAQTTTFFLSTKRSISSKSESQAAFDRSVSFVMQYFFLKAGSKAFNTLQREDDKKKETQSCKDTITVLLHNRQIL